MGKIKSRKKSRKLRRYKAWDITQTRKEVKIKIRDSFGVKDPTPYEAGNNIVEEQMKMAAKAV